MNWITRERPKVGRVGWAWVIRRFVDAEAQFHFAFCLLPFALVSQLMALRR